MARITRTVHVPPIARALFAVHRRFTQESGSGPARARILFGTQAGTKPPRFVLFSSGFLEHGYRRF
ncbi:hypothetical protein, partial [Streptomyces sp. NPDC005096]|uniref:hypothetical protein n=1 Tax=Streptomyces sp. NPDC005096 TaxID=3154559 RepID=UPI0033AA8AC1